MGRWVRGVDYIILFIKVSHTPIPVLPSRHKKHPHDIDKSILWVVDYLNKNRAAVSFSQVKINLEKNVYSFSNFETQTQTYLKI